jgi:hypothetical protein
MEEDEIKRQQVVKEKAKLIELKPVNSANIAGIGYSESDNILKVAFKNKDTFSVYLYESVEPIVYDNITNAASVGKSLSELVIKHKDKYNYIKL